jgi:epoxyqueuosine reductase QueG
MSCANQQRQPEGDLSVWVESTIKEFCLASQENSLRNEGDEKAWGEPLVGFSNGGDPLYGTIKEDIGSFYMTPVDLFEKSFPDIKVLADELTVISWILPQTQATKADNRKETQYPSERWARGKRYGELFNDVLRGHVTETLNSAGFKAVAPLLEPFLKWKASERYGIASNWSERHAAYVSGLGTFGLCDGLITPIGKAMRCGSVIAGISIQPSNRPYSDHHEYCLHFSRGACEKCIKRCPAGAISELGHDKTKCLNYLEKVTSEYVRSRFGLETHVCGLCQTAVPCESGIPVKE